MGKSLAIRSQSRSFLSNPESTLARSEKNNGVHYKMMAHTKNPKEYQPAASASARRAYYKKVGQNFYEGYMKQRRRILKTRKGYFRF